MSFDRIKASPRTRAAYARFVAIPVAVADLLAGLGRLPRAPFGRVR